MGRSVCWEAAPWDGWKRPDAPPRFASANPRLHGCCWDTFCPFLLLVVEWLEIQPLHRQDLFFCSPNPTSSTRTRLEVLGFQLMRVGNLAGSRVKKGRLKRKPAETGRPVSFFLGGVDISQRIKETEKARILIGQVLNA